MEQFYRYVAANEKRFLEELFAFLGQKSISATGEGILDCAQMLLEYMTAVGIDARLMETPGHPVVYGEIFVGEALPTVLVYGHYDVQPADPGEWDSDPFVPQIRDGRIYCRGSSDDKGQLFTHLKAVEAWRKTCGEPLVNLKFLFEGEEEVGSTHLEAFVEEHKELLRCDVVIVSDSHIHESGRPVIILGLKGMLYVELRLQGANRDLHSKYAAVVESPVWKAVSLLSSLQGEDGIIRVPGFYDDVRKPLDCELAALEKIPYDNQELLDAYGVGRFLMRRKTDNYHYNMMFEPTCNVDGIQSGYTGPGAKTVLPSRAALKVDFRLVPDQQPQKILNLLRRHLKARGFEDVELEPVNCISPCRTPVDDPYVQAVARAIEDAWGEAPLLYPSIGGSGPNYIFTTHLGAQCVTVPYAGADQNNHGPNENMILRGFYNGIKTNGAMMRELAEMGRNR